MLENEANKRILLSDDELKEISGGVTSDDTQSKTDCSEFTSIVECADNFKYCDWDYKNKKCVPMKSHMGAKY